MDFLKNLFYRKEPEEFRPKPRGKVGLVLGGGGARGAYQAGVLKGVSEITKKMGIETPFSILSGISVGAINTSVLGTYAEDLHFACNKLVDLWADLRTRKIMNTGSVSLGRIASRWILELTSGDLIKRKQARALVDNAPLHELIDQELDFRKIHLNIRKGYIDSTVVTALNYTNGKSYIFCHSNKRFEPWVRDRRKVIPSKITKEHILASSAIPLFFPPQQIGTQFFGDGNIRNNTPLSPPIRLGADRLLIVPVRSKEKTENEAFEPTLGRMLSVLMDALLLDAINFDFERLSRINETLQKLPPETKHILKPIDTLMISPSEDIAQIAYENEKHMPGSLRFLLEGLGSPEEVGTLVSALLFEPPFTTTLIDLGYQDALRSEDKIVSFYS